MNKKTLIHTRSRRSKRKAKDSRLPKKESQQKTTTITSNNGHICTCESFWMLESVSVSEVISVYSFFLFLFTRNGKKKLQLIRYAFRLDGSRYNKKCALLCDFAVDEFFVFKQFSISSIQREQHMCEIDNMHVHIHGSIINFCFSFSVHFVCVCLLRRFSFFNHLSFWFLLKKKL